MRRSKESQSWDPFLQPSWWLGVARNWLPKFILFFSLFLLFVVVCIALCGRPFLHCSGCEILKHTLARTSNKSQLQRDISFEYQNASHRWNTFINPKETIIFFSFHILCVYFKFYFILKKRHHRVSTFPWGVYHIVMQNSDATSMMAINALVVTTMTFDVTSSEHYVVRSQL